MEEHLRPLNLIALDWMCSLSEFVRSQPWLVKTVDGPISGKCFSIVGMSGECGVLPFE